MLSIEDEALQTKLIDAIRIGDGSEVARRATAIILAGKPQLVRRACLDCANLCQPVHAEAIIDVFTKKSARNTPAYRECLADTIATVMAGSRRGYDAALPAGSCRAALDEVLHLPGAESTVRNLGKLPAKLGTMWLGVVALARDAVRTGSIQEPLAQNHHLHALFEGRTPNSTETSSGDEDFELKMCALWAYSRERIGSDRPGVGASQQSTHASAAENGVERVVECDGVESSELVRCILGAK